MSLLLSCNDGDDPGRSMFGNSLFVFLKSYRHDDDDEDDGDGTIFPDVDFSVLNRVVSIIVDRGGCMEEAEDFDTGRGKKK